MIYLVVCLQQQHLFLQKINYEIFSHIENEGIIVCPIDKNNTQILVKYIKQNNKIISEEYDDVLFVPNLQGVV